MSFLVLAGVLLGAAIASVASGSVSTFSEVGKERTVLNNYVEAELLNHKGKGCLTHMWFGGDWPGYEKTRIRIYVDGEKTPSIDMEVGLGLGQGERDSPWGSQRLGKTGHPSGIYNTLRIPYGKSIRITGQRDRRSPDGAPFWWILRGTDGLGVTLAGVRLPSSARLRLYRNDSRLVQPYDEFNLCDVHTAGALYLVTIAGHGQRHTGDWKDISYLEAMIRAYLNGAALPTLLSSGLEDYFLGTYYFNRGPYSNSLAGLVHIDQKAGSFSAYRFHEDDPIFFASALRLTCRCGEVLDGRRMHDAPASEFTTNAFVYEWPVAEKPKAE